MMMQMRQRLNTKANRQDLITTPYGSTERSKLVSASIGKQEGLPSSPSSEDVRHRSLSSRQGGFTAVGRGSWFDGYSPPTQGLCLCSHLKCNFVGLEEKSRQGKLTL